MQKTKPVREYVTRSLTPNKFLSPAMNLASTNHKALVALERIVTDKHLRIEVDNHQKKR